MEQFSGFSTSIPSALVHWFFVDARRIGLPTLFTRTITSSLLQSRKTVMAIIVCVRLRVHGRVDVLVVKRAIGRVRLRKLLRLEAARSREVANKFK